MNILYIGDNNKSSTAFHRANSLSRLGHTVTHVNAREAFSLLTIKILDKASFYTGYFWVQNQICKWIDLKLIKRYSSNTFDLIWINSGEEFDSKSILRLDYFNCKKVLYQNDDPGSKRDFRRFDSLKRTMKYYDYAAVVREPNLREFADFGVKNVIRVYMSYDEEVHKPLRHRQIPTIFRSEIVFVGTWIRGEGRDKFLLDLIRAGLNISIWGSRWEKSPLWEDLKIAYKGGSLSGPDYVAAIQGADIAIGFLSHCNRDLHTRRSLEIPFIGGLLCAERTIEHERMYEEGIEAVFWRDSNECIEICKRLLSNKNLIKDIKYAGMKKVRAGAYGNQDICAKIINFIDLNKKYENK